MDQKQAIENVRKRKKYLVNLVKGDLEFCPEGITGDMVRWNTEELIKALKEL